MHAISKSRLGLAALMGLFMACASSQKESSQAPRSDDLLELLTGFGESISKRNFDKAVAYMVPEERAMLLEGGSVPPEKQKMLMALPLQKLIRHPSIRVEDGHIAGIYSMLPNLRQGEAASEMADAAAGEGQGEAAATAGGPMGAMDEEGSIASDDAAEASDEAAEAAAAKADATALKTAVNKFFAAVNRKNWNSALALMNEGERKLLLDDKGRLKESSKQRLAQIDQQNPGALTLQDGKLTGVTLLLPSSN